jgi:hypothetical protein
MGAFLQMGLAPNSDAQALLCKMKQPFNSQSVSRFFCKNQVAQPKRALPVERTAAQG